MPDVGPKYEVASVKRSDPSGPPITSLSGGPGTRNPGQLVGERITISALLIKAYGLLPWQIVAPSWLKDEPYDITAKIPPGTTVEQARVMLQNLLADRFGLVCHKETRELPTYALTVAHGGAKLKPAEPAPPGPPASAPPGGRFPNDADGFPILPPGFPRWVSTVVGGVVRATARMQTLEHERINLQAELWATVIDQTGLTGTYDYHLFYTPAYAGPPGEAADRGPEAGPSLAAALENQLGVKVVSIKGPVEVLVVDKVERTPTAN